MLVRRNAVQLGEALSSRGKVRPLYNDDVQMRRAALLHSTDLVNARF